MSSSFSKLWNSGVASRNDIDVEKAAEIEDPKGGDSERRRRELPRFSIKLRIFSSLDSSLHR